MRLTSYKERCVCNNCRARKRSYHSLCGRCGHRVNDWLIYAWFYTFPFTLERRDQYGCTLD